MTGDQRRHHLRRIARELKELDPGDRQRYEELVEEERQLRVRPVIWRFTPTGHARRRRLAKARRDRCRAAGQCIECSAPAREKRLRCAYHCEVTRQRSRERRLRERVGLENLFKEA